MKNLINLIKEYRSVLFFIGKFLIFYVLLNIIYGIYIESFGNRPDPVTGWIGDQTASILRAFYIDSSTYPLQNEPKVALLDGERRVLNLYEGCNGINVMILFISFIASFSKPQKAMLWFIPLGFLIIHLVNLFRILMLYYVAENLPDYMYFTHKYLFTAIIFAATFLLWFLWVKKYHQKT